MPAKTIFDIDCENFDLYFSQQLASITPKAKEELPKDVLFKLFKSGADKNDNNTSKFGFVAKLYILWKALKKQWILVVKDDNGLNIEQFCEITQAVKKRDYGYEEGTNKLVSYGTFLTGNKELFEALSYLNVLSVSPMYRSMMGRKNAPRHKVSEHTRQINYIINFLINYEQVKKKLIQEKALTVPEWYVLLGLYHGNEVLSSSMYNETFRYCYQSSKKQIKVAVTTLQRKRYIVKHGMFRGAKIQITPFGSDVVNDVLYKYLLKI